MYGIRLTQRNIFLWIVLFFGLSHARSVFAKTITSIGVEGNKKIETAAILGRIQSRPDSTLEANLIRSDIRSVFGLGYFENVEVYEDPDKEGVKLTFVVQEKPTVIKIEYKGLDAFEEEEIQEQILQKKYEVLDRGKLNQSIEKLLTKYEEKGYYLADIRYEVELNEARNEADVTLIVEENDKVQVRRINILGNRVLSDDDLKGILQTREGGAFSWLTGSGGYRESIFERDIAGLTYYYGTLGYVKARIGKPEVSVSADKKFVFITFHIEEGEQYSVGKIDFNGDLLFTRQELMDDIKLIQGETFNTETLRRETLRYTEKYSDLGYAFANVVPQPIIHDDTKTVDVAFEVERGERIYIGKIIITGNTRTKDKVIRRELKIREGELSNGTKKRESRENVVRLGFFDNVEFHQSTAEGAQNVVDIEIKVKERSTGQLVVSAGYSAGAGSAGFIAQAQLAQNNFLGNGQIASLSATIQTGTNYYDFNLSFQEPYLGTSNWSLGGDLFQIRRDLFSFTGVSGEVPTFRETKTGSRVSLGHPVLEFTQLFLSYKFEGSWVPASEIIDRDLINPESVNGKTSSATANLVFDKRDDRFDPRDGYYWSLSSEFAGIGGDRRYLRTKAGFKFFHPVIWDFIFRFNFTGGNISQLVDTPIPVNELFITGGLFSLRGYDQFSVGPKKRLSSNGDPATSPLSQKALDKGLSGKEIVYGGHNEVVMNAEVEFPILKDAKLRGVIFFDTGNAFDGWFTDPKPALLANFGWGIRWFTPIGPLRFEFGYPIVNPGSPKFFFTIGPPF